MTAAVVAVVVGLAALLNIIRGDFWWGWPGKPIKREDHPRAFWAFTGLLAAIAAYAAFDAVTQLS